MLEYFKAFFFCLTSFNADFNSELLLFVNICDCFQTMFVFVFVTVILVQATEAVYVSPWSLPSF